MNIKPITRSTSSRSGFTLIEVLLVVIIIGILAALAVPRFTGRTLQAQIAAANADIGRIGTALSLYELDNGTFPSSLEDLFTEPSTARNWNGPYLETGMPRDPWGQAYIYTFPGVHNPGGYDLRSLGPDGVESDADITNWQ